MEMVKELSEDHSIIKTIRSEMKNTLIEIRTIYRESTVKEMMQRIKSVIWNIKRKKQPIRTSRRKNN